jgi:foldase protein PrsA
MAMRLLRFLPLPLLLLVGALLFAGCGGGSNSSKSPKSVPQDAVAVVGDATITKTQFNDLIASAKSTYKARKTAFPKVGTTAYNSLRDQAVTYLVQESELEQKGKELNVSVTPKDITDRITQIKTQYFSGSDTKYRAQLKAQGLTEAQLKQDLYAQVLSEKLYAKVTADVKVTDAAVKAYYASHSSTYTTQASRTVRHILVSTKAKADDIEKQLKAGGDFAALAKKYSTDTSSAKNGGKLTISKGQTVPTFEKSAFSLKVNEISAPVHSQYGWHIIQALTPITPAKTTPFKSVKTQIQQTLLSTKKTNVMTKWVNQLKKSFEPTIAYQAGYAPATTATTGTTGTT